MKLNAILLVCAVIIAGGLVWYSTHNDNGTVPIIRADNSPIKERPNERGGMNIAHKDSTIYNTMRGGEQGHVENLLAERPTQGSVNRDELFAGIKAQQAKKQQEKTTILEQNIIETPPQHNEENSEENSQAPALIAAQSVSITPKAEPANDTAKRRIVNVTTPTARPQHAAKAPAVASAQSAAKPTDKKELTNLLAEVQGLKIDPIQRKKPAPAKPATFKAGNHYIQIGSLRSEAAAKSHWAARKKEFATALAGFSLRIEHIEIAQRGSFYRVQGGAVSKDTAKSACAAINARHNNSCIVK